MTCRFAPPVLVALALLLAAPDAVRASAGDPSPGAGPAVAQSSVDAVRAELAALAVRIEALKKEVAAGRAGRTQLQPLLARAQDLAAELERMQPPHAVPPTGPASPDAQELRERADALRDRADRLDRALGQLDGRISEVRRRARLDESLQSVGGAGEVLAESAPRRVSSSRGAAAGRDGAAASGVNGTSGTTPTSAPAGSAAPAPSTATPPPTSQPTSPAAPTPDAAARVLSAPPVRDLDPLLPSPGDSLQELLRKRARVQGDAADLRSQAQALESEAVRTESVR